MILKTCDGMNRFSVNLASCKNFDDASLRYAFDSLVDWVIMNEEKMSIYDPIRPWDVIEDAKKIIKSRGLEDKVSNKWLFKAHSDEETEVIAVHTVNVNGKAFTLTEVAPPKQ